MSERQSDQYKWILLALVGLMGAQVWVQWIWIGADGGVGDGVCCAFTAPVLDIFLADGTDQLGWPWSTYRRSMGLLVWPALAARKLVGPDPDFLLWLNLAFTLLTQLFLFDIGRRLAGGFAGLVAACIWPMIPAVAFMTRRWDAMTPQHLVLVVALWFLIRSARFTRFSPTMGFVGAAMAGSVLSARETDNLLFMGAVGAMALGATVAGVLTGRDATVHETKRSNILFGAIVVAGAMAVFMATYAFPLVDFSYFTDELGNRSYELGAQRLSWAALTAYPLRLYSDDLTPWIAAPFAVALLVLIRRGPARAELLTWFVLPLLALGLIGKKNFYYAAVIYPVVPLVLGVGFSRFRPGALGLVLGLATLVTGWAQFSARSLPTSTFPAALSTVHWEGPVGPQKHLFQGLVPLDLGPRGPSSHDRSLQLIAETFAESSCECPEHLLFMGTGDPSDLHLSLAMTDPCVKLSQWPRVDHPGSVGWVLIESEKCTGEPPTGVAQGGFTPVRARGDGTTCASLWKRTDTSEARLCGHKGSPPEPSADGTPQLRVHPDP